jgi:hypothetical protein
MTVKGQVEKFLPVETSISANVIVAVNIALVLNIGFNR